MSSPEDVSSFTCDTSIEWVLWLGGGKRWMLGNHDEKDDTSGEKVDGLSLVWLLKMNLWGHIVQGTELSLQRSTAISTSNWSCKTKICNFQNEFMV